MKTVYSWVKRNTSSEGKFPYTEKTKNAEDIEKTAEYVILNIYQTRVDRDKPRNLDSG